MIVVAAVVAAAKVAVHHHTLTENLITASTIAGGAAAVSAVAVFIWAKLRLDRVWAWVFRHLKEDQKITRQKELLEALGSPELVAARTEDFKSVIKTEVIPQLSTINKRIDDHMLREEAAAAENNAYMQRNTDHVCQIAKTVEQIAEEQTRVAAALVGSQSKVDDLADSLAKELNRVEQDRPIWLADREALQKYMEKGKTFMEHEDATSEKAV